MTCDAEKKAETLGLKLEGLPGLLRDFQCGFLCQASLASLRDDFYGVGEIRKHIQFLAQWHVRDLQQMRDLRALGGAKEPRVIGILATLHAS